MRSWPDGQDRKVAADFDRSPDSLVFSPDGKTLFVTADDLGNTSLFTIDVATGKTSRLIDKGHVRHPEVFGKALIYGYDTLTTPVDLFVLDLAAPKAAPRRLTAANAERLAEIGFTAFEQFDFAGWNGEKVHGYVVKPFRLPEEGKKYPVAFLIHGGPQGSMKNEFHYRWNAPVLRRSRLRGGDDRFPRFDRLWPSLHGLDFGRLGRQTARRSAERLGGGAGQIPLPRRRPRLRSRCFLPAAT